jgi:hypothetical protein
VARPRKQSRQLRFHIEAAVVGANHDSHPLPFF